MTRTLSRIGRMAILVCLGGLGAFALRAEWQPGLKVGTVSGQANWTDWPAETNTTLRLDATEKAENRGAYAFWAENVTYVYWGQMYFQEGVYHFGEYMDDSAWVEIDGKVVLKDTLWNQRMSSGDVPMTEGWHDVAFRFGNGSGGAGPVAGLNWTATKGFGYNCNGKDSTDGNDYELLFDTGDGAFFRHDDGTGFGNPILGKVSANVIDGARATVSADLVSLGNGSDSAELTLYYGVVDGGTDAAAWNCAQALPTATAAGEQTATVTDLTAETTYFFRIYAKNARGEAWSEAKSFKSWGVPALASADCTGVAPAAAEFVWELGAGTFAWCGVELREKDGAAVETTLGLFPSGERKDETIAGLTPGMAYEWTVVASNGLGVVRSEVKEFTTLTATVAKRSVKGGSWGESDTWEPAGVPVFGEAVTVSAGTAVTNVAATAQLASLTVEEGGELFVDGWDSAIRADGAVTVAGRLVHAVNEVLAPNAAGEWVPTARVWVECGSFALTETGVVDGRGRGYPGARKGEGDPNKDPAQGGSYGRGPAGGRFYCSGGGHGGTGGWLENSFGAYLPERRRPAYDSVTEPTQPGSGANKADDWDAGCGGGVVRIVATGDVRIDGTVDVDGTMKEEIPRLNHYMGGAGGSVWISCARILGSGRVSANGGPGVYYGGGGGGGRIAVNYDLAAQSAVDLPGVRFLALGGSADFEDGDMVGGKRRLALRRYVNVKAGSLGTLWFPDSQLLVRSLAAGAFRHGGLWMAPGVPADLVVDGDLLVDGGALALPAAANLTVTGNLSVKGSTYPEKKSDGLLRTMVQPSSRLMLTNGTLVVGGTFAATNTFVELLNSTLSVAGDVDFSCVRGVAGSDGEFRPVWTFGGSARFSGGTAVIVESGADGARPTSIQEIPASGGALLSVAKELSLVKSSVWPKSHPTNGGSPWFHVGSLVIDKDSSFDADRFGFAGYVKEKGVGRGPGGGYGGSGQVAKAGGGGYGGRGANAATIGDKDWGATYGSASAPYLPGSSGGCVEDHAPDAGGAIRILCDGTLTMNGALTAGGSPYTPLGNWGCGASGGAVWVICRSFKGTNPDAKLKAVGSDGVNANYIAGGGGRIAVWMGVRPRTTGTHVAKLLAEETGAAFATEQPASWAGTTSAAAGSKVKDAPTYQHSDAEDGTVTWLSIPSGGLMFFIR